MMTQPKPQTEYRSTGFQQTLWIIYSGIFLVMLLQLVYPVFLSPRSTPIPIGLWFGFLVLLMFIVLDLLQPRLDRFDTRSIWLMLAVRVLLVELYGLSQQSLTAATSFYLLVPFIIYPYTDKRIRYLILLVISIRALIPFGIEFQQFYWQGLTEFYLELVAVSVGYGLIVALIGVLIDTVDREKQQRLQSEYLLDELEKLHTQVVELAAVEERNRIARDIHDSLGHYLTVINVQLEKAIALAEKSPAVSTQAVGDAKRLTVDALQEVRQSVAVLRGRRSSFNLEERIKTLLQDVSSADLAIQFRLTGSQSGYSEHCLMTLFRVSQEAVTNICKYVQRGSAAISIIFTPSEVTLKIEDNGPGFDTEKVENGFGLIGARERVERLGGTFAIHSHRENGTVLIVHIPCNPIHLRRLEMRKG
jgi:signal transduction histidine kinase